MLALFLASFAATWTVQSRSVGAVMPAAAPVPLVQIVPAMNLPRGSAPEGEADAMGLLEPAPTLAQLTVDADADTQAEAWALMGLLDAEGRSDSD